jgi:uncharacterized protein
MLVWIDLSNSPHVRLFEPLTRTFEGQGWETLVTVRDHAQTLALARERWPDAAVIGGRSPSGRAAKGRAVLERARDLARFARSVRPDVALSHGSYGQIVAARAVGVPAATMMDYEHQPANHLSFRLATRVIVPDAFPEASLRRQGARAGRVVRYSGFKEELYLAEFEPSGRVVTELGLDEVRDRVLAVFRPPPAGALYHRSVNERFDDVLREAVERDDVHAVLLPRWTEQSTKYRGMPGLCVPDKAIDACSLMASADVVIGAGGTMNREAALLGTPAYTVFTGALAAVDAELIRLGLLHDLRDPASRPELIRKPRATRRTVAAEHAAGIVSIVSDVVAELGASQMARRRLSRLWPKGRRGDALS